MVVSWVIGVPLAIIHLSLGFSTRNQPLLGYPDDYGNHHVIFTATILPIVFTFYHHVITIHFGSNHLILEISSAGHLRPLALGGPLGDGLGVIVCSLVLQGLCQDGGWRNKKISPESIPNSQKQKQLTNTQWVK